ncbi:MAG: hypothetical protein WC352_02445 [Candidatus Omnitrophota bacterium]|jgi:hypothetical protein
MPENYVRKSGDKKRIISNLADAATKLWTWLREKEEYRNAYGHQLLFFEKMKNMLHEAGTNALALYETKSIDNWGFFPLEDPVKKIAPVGMQVAILDLVGRAPDGTIRLMNIDGVSLNLQAGNVKLSPSPKKEFARYLEKPIPKPHFLKIDVDYRQTDDEIWKDLKHKLKLFRSYHGIKPKRFRSADTEDFVHLYKVFVCEQLGWKPQEIQMAVYGKRDHYPRQDYRKRTARLRKRVLGEMPA